MAWFLARNANECKNGLEMEYSKDSIQIICRPTFFSGTNFSFLDSRRECRNVMNVAVKFFTRMFTQMNFKTMWSTKLLLTECAIVGLDKFDVFVLAAGLGAF